MSHDKHEEMPEAERVVRRWIDEVFNQHKFEAIDELLVPDYVLHYYAMNGDLNVAAYKQLHPAFLKAFPDLSMEILDLLTHGDTVTVRLMQRGTHLGELMGVPPSGKLVEQVAIAIYRVAGGKLVEGWAAETPWPVTLAALHDKPA